MSTQQPDPIFCTNIGATGANPPNALNCCSPSDKDSALCHSIFNPPNNHYFSGSCFGAGRDCLAECQHPFRIYSSKSQNDYEDGNGSAPKHRYLTCVNVPNMAGYLRQGVLGPNITSQVEQHVSRDATEEQLQNVSYAVTECLSATCRNSRRPKKCQKQCSGVNLLRNWTTPDIQGIDQCLDTLCAGGYESLPYADSDVVGIGVFASYIMQCAVVVILWFCVTALNPPRLRKKKRTSAEIEEQQAHSDPVPPLGTDTKEKHPHRHNFASVLVQFHKTQCYFSATVQIASLTYGIFSTDMLNVFLLVPLATNGILPIVFTYILLLRYHRATLDTTILTTVCWILASLVYWILYSHVIPINGEIRNQNANYSAYEQFMYKLSALEACGGYSALAVCPDNFSLGKDEIVRASWRLRALTPVLWSFSSICLIVALGEEVKRRRREWKYHTVEQGTEVKDESRHGTEPYHHKVTSGHEHGTHSLFKNSVVYCTVTALFLACVGMQLSLLSVSLSLKMTNVHNWTFGQIVAITVWTPPLLGYLYDEVRVFMPERFKTSTDELG